MNQNEPIILTESERNLLVEACTAALLYCRVVLRGLDDEDLEPFFELAPDYELDDDDQSMAAMQDKSILYDKAAAYVYSRMDKFEAMADRIKQRYNL